MHFEVLKNFTSAAICLSIMTIQDRKIFRKLKNFKYLFIPKTKSKKLKRFVGKIGPLGMNEVTFNYLTFMFKCFEMTP